MVTVTAVATTLQTTTATTAETDVTVTEPAEAMSAVAAVAAAATRKSVIANAPLSPGNLSAATLAHAKKPDAVTVAIEMMALTLDLLPAPLPTKETVLVPAHQWEHLRLHLLPLPLHHHHPATTPAAGALAGTAATETKAATANESAEATEAVTVITEKAAEAPATASVAVLTKTITLVVVMEASVASVWAMTTSDLVVDNERHMDVALPYLLQSPILFPFFLFFPPFCLLFLSFFSDNVLQFASNRCLGMTSSVLFYPYLALLELMKTMEIF